MKLRLRAASAAFAYLLSVTTCFAATLNAPSVVHDYGSWLPITAKIPLYRHWFIWTELMPMFQRSHHPALSEMQIRPSLGYQFNPRWSLLGGLFWSPHFDKKVDNERMLWQQLSYSRKFDRVTIQNRFRPEEVWRNSYQGCEVRLRNQLRVTYDLGRSSYYLAASDEPFYNLNDRPHGPVTGFAENRLFVGVGKRLNRFTRVEIGYMNQYKNNRTGGPDKSNHVLLASLNFDFTAAKPVRQYKLASIQNQVAVVPQVVMSDFYSPSALMFSAPDLTVTRYHPALAGVVRSRNM
jgi:hypothetical protein